MADLGRAAYGLAQSLSKASTSARIATNSVINGDFSSSSAGGWVGTLATTNIDIINKEAGLTATAQYGQFAETVKLIAGHKYYYCADVMASSNLVKLDIYDATNLIQTGVKSHPGDGMYTTITGIASPTKDTTQGKFRVLDYRLSGWNAIKIKNCLLVDLTAIYGAGKEPSDVDFGNLLKAQLGRLFFDESTVLTISLVGKVGQSVNGIANILVNGSFALNSVWSGYLATTSIDTVNKEGTFTATATAGQILQYVNLMSGRKYYFCANVKASSANVKFDVYDGTNALSYGLTPHIGNAKYNKLSGIITPTKDATSALFRISDYRSSGWDVVKVQNCILVDLTSAYGAGKEPSTPDFESALQNKFNGLFFDGLDSVSTPIFGQQQIGLVGVLKGNGAGDISAAVPGVDYAIGSTKNMVVNITGNRIRCASKYNASKDLWVDLNKEGSNLLCQISAFYLADNPSGRVSPNLANTSKTTLSIIGTDMIGPYVVKANANGNAEPSSFTGGWHGYDNSGSDTRRTATTVSVNVYADGYLVGDGETAACDRIDIEVVNNVNGWNTKQTDSLGRNVLTETVHYTVTPGGIEVTNDIKALEDITIQTYYGLQTKDSTDWTTVHYVNGSQSGRVAVPADHDSGAKSTYSSVDRWTLNKGANYLIAWLDNTYGLGDRANIPTTYPMAFSTAIGKTYMNLIRTDTIVIAGNVVSWRGGFILTESIPCVGADLAYAYKEGNQQKYVVDFLTANTGTLLGTKQNDRNKSVIVDIKSAAVTVGGRIGSTGLSLSTTGYGQAKLIV